MPIYEYRCENGHSFEAFQAMADDPLERCEVCDAPAARVLSAPAVHFKGSGFYTTDYARKGAKKAGGDAGDGKDKGDSAGGKGSDAKASSSSSETKTASKSGSGD